MQESSECTFCALRAFTDVGDIQGDNPLVRYLPYNARFPSEPIMEAERINQIASTLADLNTRSEELRRYL